MTSLPACRIELVKENAFLEKAVSECAELPKCPLTAALPQPAGEIRNTETAALSFSVT